MSLQITPQTIRDLRVAISMAIAKGRGTASPFWSRFASKVSANAKHVSLPMHAATAKLRRWEGERKVIGGKCYDYRVTPEKFELTLAIPVEEIEDDNIGAWQHTMEDMGVQIELWPDDLVVEVILAGETGLAFDGLAFFANTHSLKTGTTIDNLFTSTSLTKANAAAVVAEMKGWVGEDGRSLRVTPNKLVVPPALEDTGREICASDLLAKVFGSNTAAAADTNSMRGRLELEVLSELSADAGGSDTDWYVKDCTKPTKPYVFVERVKPTVTNKNSSTDDNVFNDDEVKTGVRARGAAGYGPFWLAAKCKA
jgi:phage major head subunit gpT-like protein